MSESDLRSAFERAGQGHVFAASRHLSPPDRSRLLEVASRIDLDLVRALGELANEAHAKAGPARFEPPDVVTLEQSARRDGDMQRARERGAELLGAKQVGFLLVAGGQGSRLGFDGPKGVFPAGPVTGRTLFQIFARRLIAARERFGAHPWWYVMTSEATDAATRAYFEQNGFFGLRRDDVYFFQQAMLPALDEKGRIVMADATTPFLAPNGHGGTLSAMRDSGALAHAQERGIKTFSYFQVDNPLALPGDPLFLGLHALRGASMSSKVVKKRDAAEKVGVLGKVDGKLTCIEYSDLPADLREARDGKGELVYGAGNIALHAIDAAFVDALTKGGLRLPWHVARKDVTGLDDSGICTQRKAFKFETFVFDALAFAERTVTLEVDRAREFSPIKNATGDDSPRSARTAQCKLYADWARRAGNALPPADPNGDHEVEVDPVVAEDVETFVARRREPQIDERGHFYG